MSKKKRLAVNVFYNAEGIAADYYIFLLNSLKNGGVADKLLVVVNGKIQADSLAAVEAVADQVVVRDNIGFDGGAYKDVFTKMIGKEALRSFDECILLNDTFYGPFYPWEDIFADMENVAADFWGLSRWIGGAGIDTGDVYLTEHIQAYFIVVRKHLLHSDDFVHFWENMPYPQGYAEAIRYFEVAFTRYFNERGYYHGTWLDVKGGDILLAESENVYLEYGQELVVQWGFPIVKKRLFRMEYFEKILLIFKYLQDNSLYDINFFRPIVRQMWGQLGLLLEAFIKGRKKIFVYGNGRLSRILRGYFTCNGWQYAGIVVTNPAPNEKNVIAFAEFAMDDEDGLILAMGKKNCLDVLPEVRQRYKKEQFLCLRHGDK